MAFRNGPQYPGVSRGLVFLFEPPSPISVPNASGDTTTVYNAIDSSQSGSTSFEGADDEWANAKTLEGYMTYDATDDDIDFGDICSFEYNNAFSINVWISPDWTANKYLVAKSRDGTNPSLNMYRGYHFAINGSKKLSFAMYNYGYIGVPGMTVTGGTTIDNFSGWQNLCCTYDGSGNRSGMKSYINGVAETLTGTGDSTLSTTIVTTFPLLLAAQAGDTKFYDGSMGPVMIYNRELTEAEALQNYNQLKGRFQ